MRKRGANIPSQRKRRVRRKNHSDFLDPPPPPSSESDNHRGGGESNADANAEAPTDVNIGPTVAEPDAQIYEDLGIDNHDFADIPFVSDVAFSAGIPVDDDAEEESALIRSAQSSKLKSQDVFRMLTEGKTLAAVFSVVGSRRFAVWQYNITRRRVNYHLNKTEPGAYPSYSKIQQYVFPLLRKHVYVPSTTVRMEVDCSKAGAPSAFIGNSGGVTIPTREIRFVPVSSWGRVDLRSRNRFGTGEGNTFLSREAQENVHLFDSMEDAIAARMRAVVLSSTVVHKTDVIDGFQIPSAIYDSECYVDVWLRPRGALGQLRHFVSTFGNGGNRFVLRGMKCGEKHLVTEASPIFDAGDVVLQLDCGTDASCNDGLVPGTKIYIVYKMKTSPGVPRIHVALTQPCAGDMNIERVRCSHVMSNREPWRNPSEASRRNRSRTHTATTARGSGILQDGREFVVYRVILFADNFDPFVGSKGSAGGCYLLPVGIPIRERTGMKGIRVLGMTPPGITTGKVLTALVPDIIEGTINGFEIIDDRGDSVQLFLDVIGYQCDYYAVSEESDLRGHNALVPCNLCTFERGNRSGRENSMYAYSTEIHSGNAAFRRDAARMRALRQEFEADSVRKEQNLQGVGLREIIEEDRRRLPLHALHDALTEVRGKVPLTIDGEPVVPAVFDPYLSIVIAPDHLFANLIKDVVNANIKSLSRREGRRSCMHSVLRDGLRRNCIQTEYQYIDEEGGKVHGMSMAALFKVILVAPWAIALARSMDASGNLDLGNYEAEDVVTLAFMLKDLLADTNLYARPCRDGHAAAKEFTSEGWKGRESYLKLQAFKYLAALDRCCGISEVHAKELDKPNVHRLLELYVHTIPTFGHVRQYQELSLERTHQPLKRALNNSNHRSAQLQVMDHALADDWKGRLKAATGGITSFECLDESCLSKLQQTLTGSAFSNEEQPVNEHVLRKVFDAALLHDIRDFASVQCETSNSRETTHRWVGTGGYVMQSAEGPFVELNRTAKAKILSLLKTENTSHRALVECLARATLKSMADGSQPHPHRDAYDSNIRRGDIVQAVVSVPQQPMGCQEEEGSFPVLSAGCNHLERATFTDNMCENDCKPSFWYVTELFETQPAVKIGSFSTNVLAGVIPMVSTESRHYSAMDDGASPFPPTYSTEGASSPSPCLLPLYHGVMKPMRLHACSGACTFDATTHKLVHRFGDDGMDRWVIYGSLQGFPPRSG